MATPLQTGRLELLEVDFWQKLAPQFPIGGKIDSTPFIVPAQNRRTLKKQIIEEGYVHLINPGLNSPLEKVAKLVVKIASLGLPPVFSFVYDEMWKISAQLGNLMGILLREDFAMLPAFWVWHIAPGEAGWKPHRDKIAGSLFPDKKPKSLTVWIPLTEAHPLNSCIYVLPADRDEEYGMENSVRGIGELSDMRALPAKPGDVLVWTQHLFHWGGHAAKKHGLPPRISIGLEYQVKSVRPFQTPLLGSAPELSFEERLALIGQQIAYYRRPTGCDQALWELIGAIAKTCKLPKESA